VEDRPHEPEEPARHVAELQGTMNFQHTRGNVWRYEPWRTRPPPRALRARRDLRRPRGEPHDAPRLAAGGILHVSAGTPLQTVNAGDEDLVVYAYGAPPDQGADVLPPAD
jgi:hypothetical protein